MNGISESNCLWKRSVLVHGNYKHWVTGILWDWLVLRSLWNNGFLEKPSHKCSSKSHESCMTPALSWLGKGAVGCRETDLISSGRGPHNFCAHCHNLFYLTLTYTDEQWLILLNSGELLLQMALLRGNSFIYASRFCRTWLLSRLVEATVQLPACLCQGKMITYAYCLCLQSIL